MTTDPRMPASALGQRERLAISAALILGLLTLFLVLEPIEALVIAVVVVSGWALLKFPDLGTSVALFLFYSNLVAVGVKYHGVPKVLGASVALLLVIPLIHHLLLQGRPIVLPRPLGWLLFLVVVNIVGAVLSRDPERSLASAMNFLLEGVVLYLLLANVVRTKNALRVSLLVLLAAGALMAVVPLYQQATGDYENIYGGLGVVSGGRGFRTGDVSFEGDVRQRRLAGPIGEQNRYAQVMLVLVPIGIFGFVASPDRRVRLLALAGGGLAAAGATVAFSRGGAVGFAAMLVVGFLFRYLGKRELITIGVAGILLVAAAPQYVGRLLTLDSALKVMVEGKGAAGELDDGAIAGRATEMGAAVMVFADHPIIGVGPGMFRFYSGEYGERIGLRQLEGDRQAHSFLPDVAAEHGAAGLVAYLFVIGLTLGELHRGRLRWLQRDPELATLVTGILLAIVTHLMVGMFMHRAYIRYFWLIMGLAAAACHIASEPRVDSRIGSSVETG